MNEIFHLTYSFLREIEYFTGFCYEEVNIIIWYMLLPLVYMILFDKIFRTYYFSLSFVTVWILTLLYLIRDFKEFSLSLFDLSVKFLNSFSWLGWDYVVSSVMVCVLLPGALLLYLCWKAYSKQFMLFIEGK